jgi:hypothetical protein
MKSAGLIFLTNPSSADVLNLLVQCRSDGLRGIEDEDGNVHVWPYDQATHMIAATILRIPYDPSTDFVNKLTGKTFYIRSLDDWVNRECRRSEPNSFSSVCRKRNNA